MDLSSTLNDVKSLSDHELHHELANPSGLIPGYMLLAEVQGRKTLRDTTEMDADKRPDMAQEISIKGYDRGGLIAGINPFNAYMLGLRNQNALARRPYNPDGGMMEQAQPAAPSAPPELSSLVPLPPGQPVVPYARGGVVALRPEIAQGIYQSAAALGISPLDLATAISYETGGTFNPTQTGPTTQWGTHKGLIQFGEPQAKQYGVDWRDPIGSQLGPDGAVVKYLRSTGVRPGMGLPDVYSAINAGHVGRYNASDANNGGAPGTVLDKVASMGPHQQKAAALLGSSLPDGYQGQVSYTPDGQAWQYAQTTGMDGYTGDEGWIRADPNAVGGGNPMAGLMALAMASQQQAAPPPMPAPVRKAQPKDPEQQTEDTSMTPDWYRRRHG
jgi:hypothetical protein